MARLPTFVVLLVLAAAGLALAQASTAAAAAAEAPPPPEGKVRVTLRYADAEEAQWLDRWAKTHQPLGSCRGCRFTLTPATPEVSAWLNRLSGRTSEGAREARDGEGGATAGGSSFDGSHHHIVFNHGDPRGRVIQAFLARLARMSEDLERAKAEEHKDTKDL